MQHIKRVQTTLDAYPAAPPELELQQVHVYVRHGERTPVRVRMNAPPASIPEHWMFCHAPTAELPFRMVVERKDGSPAPGQCLLGELTDVGRESTHNYGRALRRLYIDRLAFLPRTLPDPNLETETEDPETDLLYFRSTNTQRTIESLHHLMRGLYPEDAMRVRVRVRNMQEENLVGNTVAYPRLGELLGGFARAAALTYNPTLAPLDAQLSKYIGGNPIRVDGSPSASEVMDTIRAARAHGIRVPPEFEEEEVVELIERAVVAESFEGYKTEEVRRLGMGPLLGDLARKLRMKAAASPVQEGEHADATNGGGPKLLVHAMHDTGLAGLLATLDVFDDKWPEFTASITFELFKKRVHTTAPSEHYVRVRYQNKTLLLPLCARAGAHPPGSPEFCTLARFSERVAELALGLGEGACAVRD